MAEKAIKHDVFVWSGTDKRGVHQKGELRSASAALVKADLRRQGINPGKVKKKSASLFGAGGPKRKRIKPGDIAIFSRQLATMMTAGVPLVQSFEIVGRGHDNPAMQDLVLGIKADVEAGGTLSDALRKRPLYFDDLFCNLVSAGEQAGILEDLLHKIAAYKEKTEAIKGKVKKAMFYPTAIMITAFIVTAILLIFVVPQFAAIFAGFGADLPAMTLFVLAISNMFQEWWWAIFGTIGGVIYGLLQAKKRSRTFAQNLDRMLLKVPIIGNILTKAAIARFARTMATMFAAGVPLVEAMASVAGATGNIVYSQAVMRMRDEVSTGMSLNLSMAQTGVFPNMVCQMVAIGEEAGAIDTMLSKVADFYEEEVENAVDGMSSLIEPLIMAFLGVVIGGLVIAMYLPIFKLGEVV
ncbi:MAG: type IV pilus assembly protein PilC [Gammaproteobacteria bacterium]|nr:MAG: type IV pilus assembly protein PilC [Gammaproteobacteria bacterium]TND03665.1 MAG: type IV pilus assembly protein PilC [Gammaproteobacteria bacterium]